MRFADLTTLRVGGPIAHPHEARTRGELVDFARAHPLADRGEGAAPLDRKSTRLNSSHPK